MPHRDPPATCPVCGAAIMPHTGRYYDCGASVDPAERWIGQACPQAAATVAALRWRVAELEEERGQLRKCGCGVIYDRINGGACKCGVDRLSAAASTLRARVEALEAAGRPFAEWSGMNRWNPNLTLCVVSDGCEDTGITVGDCRVMLALIQRSGDGK